MKRTVICAFLLMTAQPLFAAESKPEASKTNEATPVAPNAMKSFAGTWEFVTIEPASAANGAQRLVFNTNGTYSAQDGNGKELWAGTFEIDPSACPKVWDHRSYDALKEGKDVLGIYDLSGDHLKLACVVGQRKGQDWIGKPRPAGFSSEEADVVIELKRITAK